MSLLWIFLASPTIGNGFDIVRAEPTQSNQLVKLHAPAGLARRDLIDAEFVVGEGEFAGQKGIA